MCKVQINVNMKIIVVVIRKTDGKGYNAVKTTKENCNSSDKGETSITEKYYS